jgi:hypothetical protein
MPIISAIIIVVRILVLYRARKAQKGRIAEIIEKEGVRAYILGLASARVLSVFLAVWRRGAGHVPEGFRKRT